jgi:hypothetical protein
VVEIKRGVVAAFVERVIEASREDMTLFDADVLG